MVPGLPVIDTPRHESFTNLRSWGSRLWDITIFAADITHGLEPQTSESPNLLRMRNTDFIVALKRVRYTAVSYFNCTGKTEHSAKISGPLQLQIEGNLITAMQHADEEEDINKVLRFRESLQAEMDQAHPLYLPYALLTTLCKNVIVNRHVY
ncbi:hypothetical protein POM88_034002 [Heracleum sosnowskyi]|uniref:Tr-type G domain-containing protein n=1 Tax=Heracleum sosnowskyi TaxID=360622 RepID=A0AAD8HIG0_9APIA|nr:hypothetical protein POM88_034002 [Heracleum sosnowskyi]